jgi:DNA-binding phage protein
MKVDTANIRHIVPHGGMTLIAQKLGITRQAVSQALKAARPSNPIVQEAIRMAQESGTVDAARILASIRTI